jgi:hypothetical protein
LASCTNSLQASDKIGSGFTYKCDLPVHHLPVGSVGYPRPRCRFLNWFVLHDKVVSLMRNFISGGPGVFLSGTHTPRPCSSHYSCGIAATVLVCPEYFISPGPSTYIDDEHSPIRHLGRHPMGDRRLHTAVFIIYD